MSNLWIPVIAALGGSFLTGLVAFGLEWWRSSQAGKSAQSERRTRAYLTLLTQSTMIAHMADGLHLTMQFRSGLSEGINTTLGRQRPIDPLEMTDRLQVVLQPLYEALSEVWVIGSKEAIAEANDLAVHSGAVMGAATQRGEARPGLLGIIAGEKWTQEQLDQWQKELVAMAEARRRFAITARREAGVEFAEPFSSSELKHPSNV